MKVRVVYKPDKTVTVIHPVPKSKRPDETEDQWLERIFTKAMQGELAGLDYDDIDEIELPQNRDDRDAWEGEKGTGIYINQKKAQELKLKRSEDRRINEEIKKLGRHSIEAATPNSKENYFRTLEEKIKKLENRISTLESQ